MERLELTDKGKRKAYLAGLDLKHSYKAFSKKLGRWDIRADSLDLNHTIQTASTFLLGAYDSFGDLKLGFSNSDNRTFPPEELQIDPSELDFDTALPHGIRFVPVFTSSGHQDLKFMMVDTGFCPKLTKLTNSRITALEQKLNASEPFMTKLTEIEHLFTKNFQLVEIDNFGKQKLSGANAIEKPLEKCLRFYFEGLTFEENFDVLKIKKKHKKLLESCFAAYWFIQFDNNFVSQVQSSPLQNSLIEGLKQIEEAYLKADGAKEFAKLKFMSLETGQLVALLNRFGLFRNSLECVERDLLAGGELIGEGLEASECQKLPPASSNLIFEVKNSGQKNELLVKVLYNKQPVPCLEGSAVDETGHLCDFGRFVEHLNKTSLESHKHLCGLHLAHKHPKVKVDSSHLIPYFIVFGLLALSVVFCLVANFNAKKLKDLEDLVERELGPNSEDIKDVSEGKEKVE